MVPLAAFSHFEPGHTPLAVNHQGLFVASTISYNLLPGAAFGDAEREIQAAMTASSPGHDSWQPSGHRASLRGVVSE